MRIRVVIAVGVLGLSCAAWWGARNAVIGTEPLVARPSIRAVNSEVSNAAQVLVRTKILEADREAVSDVWKRLEKGATAERKAEAAGSLVQARAFPENDVRTAVEELSKNPSTAVRCDLSIRVVSGYVASFNNGGKFGVPTIVGVGGSEGTTTTSRNFGTSLEVKPTVLAEGQIRLALSCEVSQIDESVTVAGVPGINVSRVNTNQLVAPGQAVVIVLPAHPEKKVTVKEANSAAKGTETTAAKKVSDPIERSLLLIVMPEVLKPMSDDHVAPIATVPQMVEGKSSFVPYSTYTTQPPTLRQPLPPYWPEGSAPGGVRDLLLRTPEFPNAPWPPAQLVPFGTFPPPVASANPVPGFYSVPLSPPELTRLQHLQSAKVHLDQAGLADEAATVQTEIKREERSVAQRELQRRERELERLQTEIESLRRSLSEEAESSSQ